MNEYNLKDKLSLTPELLDSLTSKGWQEIEHLQAQIANIEDVSLNQLLKNLLTSYYVFVGGLENLASGEVDTNTLEKLSHSTDQEENEFDEASLSEILHEEPIEKPVINSKDASFEPFEYFVDFDEPIGEPLSDEDLYN
jgi:hypothetical protein